MTTIAHLMYASPAWWGYTSAGERDRIEQLMKRLRRGQYLPPQSPSAAEMAAEADERLFTCSSVRNDEHHVLHRLFPPPRPTCGHVLLGHMASLFQTRTTATSFLEYYIKTYSE